MSRPRYVRWEGVMKNRRKVSAWSWWRTSTRQGQFCGKSTPRSEEETRRMLTRVDMFTRLDIDLCRHGSRGDFLVSQRSQSRVDWFFSDLEWYSLEWIDFFLTLNDTALSGPTFYSLYWSQSWVDQNFLVSIEPNLEWTRISSLHWSQSWVDQTFSDSIDPNLERIDIITVLLIPVSRRL